MTSRLERRYRTLLKVLPSWYREEREEEMVASFLDGRPGDDLDPEYGWPGWGETGATLALALRTRMERPVGESVRLLGMFGLLLGVAIAATSVVTSIDHEPHRLLAHAAAAAALIAATRGAVVETRVLAAIPLAFGLYPVVTRQLGPFLTDLAFLLPAAITLLALCATPPKASPRWLWAGAAAVASGAALPFAGIYPTSAAAVALLVAALVFRRRTWMIAIAAAACALLPWTIVLVSLERWPVIALGATLLVVVLRLSGAVPLPRPVTTPAPHATSARAPGQEPL